jgi:hypothetical protein
MYGQRFGTDWDSLSTDAVIERGYALGVAEVVGETPDGEYDRLEDQTDSAYERSMLELAYQDGKSEALGLEAEDAAAVWGELVEGEELAAGDVDPGVEPDEFDGKDSRAATKRGEMLDRPDEDSTEAVSRPDFLERD